MSAAVLLVHSSGCSLAFVETVPDAPQQQPYFDCTSTIGLPVADGVFALGSAVTGGVTLATSKEEFEAENDGASRDLYAGASIAFAAAMLASGIYGIITTQECSSAKDELRARLMSASESTHVPIEPPLTTPEPTIAPPPVEAPAPAAAPATPPPAAGPQVPPAPPPAAPPSAPPQTPPTTP